MGELFSRKRAAAIGIVNGCGNMANVYVLNYILIPQRVRMRVAYAH
jgi:hypothetical protein